MMNESFVLKNWIFTFDKEIYLTKSDAKYLLNTEYDLKAHIFTGLSPVDKSVDTVHNFAVKVRKTLFCVLLSIVEYC